MDSNTVTAPTTTSQQPASPVPSKFEDKVDSVTRSTNVEETSRPRVLFDSPSVFLETLLARFASIWTKRFILSVVAGQFVSLCITCMDVSTTELVNRGWVLPTTQTFFLWVQRFIPHII